MTQDPLPYGDFHIDTHYYVHVIIESPLGAPRNMAKTGFDGLERLRV